MTQHQKTNPGQLGDVSSSCPHLPGASAGLGFNPQWEQIGNVITGRRTLFYHPEIVSNTPCQVLFVEACLSVKPGQIHRLLREQTEFETDLDFRLTRLALNEQCCITN